jgi:hypothetical protein
MSWEGNYFYYIPKYIDLKIFSYSEVLISTLLLFSECSKIFLLVRLEHVSISHTLYKTKLDTWRYFEISMIVLTLFLQMFDLNVFTPIFFFILAHEYIKKDDQEIESSSTTQLYYRKIELFVKFVFYLMILYFNVVNILLKYGD